MNDALALSAVTSLVLFVVLYVWTAASLAAVFAKIGEEGYKAWIPVANIVVLLQLAGLSGWLALLILVPPALWIVLIVACHRIGRGFGLGAGMTVLAALLFPVWSSIVGWGSARWLGWGTRRLGAGAPRTGVPPRPPVPVYPPVSPAVSPEGSAPAVPAPPVTARHPGPPAPGPVADPAPPVTGAHPVRPAPAAHPRPAPGAYPPPAAPAAYPPPAAPVPPVAGIPPRPAAPVPPPSTPPPATGPAGPVEADEWSASADTRVGGGPGGDDGARRGRSHAPFTGTFPSGSAAAHPAPPAPPRRAFTPEPGAVPPPVSPFTPVSAPPDAPAAAAGPAAPVQDVPTPAPASPAPPGDADPWAPPIPLPNLPVSARAAADAARAARPEDLDASAEVSAVAEVPLLGGPRSARASVSAQHRRPEIPDGEVFDETVIASRHRPSWSLLLPSGGAVAVTADVVIVGRRPSADLTRPDAQLVPVSDDTRTVSKTHARLERTDAGWTIVDLDSTNGVVLVREDGAEIELEPGAAAPVTERFLLGDAELGLVAGGRDAT